jgi:hypothetical protein
MDEAFPQSLTDWSAYFTLMGGAAATLLGLLFVAVSLRLNIFRQREVADVRRFAAITLGTFLAALGISGLTLAPYGRREVLAAGMLVIGLAGMAAIVSLARLWRTLETPVERALLSVRLRGLGYFSMISAPYVGALAAAVLLWQAHPHALGWLAVVDVAFLAIGTGATGLLLSHASGQTNAA